MPGSPRLRQYFTGAFSLLAFACGGAESPLADLVINEIMYNSPGSPDVEYIELYNAGDAARDLSGWTVIDDDPQHPACPLAGLLAAGEFLVVAGDLDLFSARYPGVSNVNPHAFDPGGAGFSLGNAGDTVHLYDALSDLHDLVAYAEGGAWPPEADGGGPSLELEHPLLDNSLPESWEASVVDWGTPGAINSAYHADQNPICRDGWRGIDLPVATDIVAVSVFAWDLEQLDDVELWVDTGAGYLPQPMFDDGLHGDGAAGDSVFSSAIPPQSDGTLVRYYAVARDSLGQVDAWPGGAPLEYRAYTVGHVPPALRVTEILARNETGIVDEYGELEDWIEITNTGTTGVQLAGMYLSDELGASHQWMLPAFLLPPQERLIIWADGEMGEGDFHASFRLSASGEAVGLFESEDMGNVLIDGYEYGLAGADIAVGYFPADADFPEYLSPPTPGLPNAQSAPLSAACINEFLTTSEGGGIDDWVEIYNRGGQAVDLSGWMLSDSRSEPAKFVFPPGSLLESQQFLVLDESVLGFSFTSGGQEIIQLTAADGVTGMDFYDFGEQPPDLSEGRYPDGLAYWDFLAAPSPGEENLPPVSVPWDLPTAIGLRLIGAHPNPFNPETWIRFELAAAAVVEVDLYDLAGRRVRRLLRERREAGPNRLRWDGRDDGGRALASGLYLARLRAMETSASLKLLLLK